MNDETIKGIRPRPKAKTGVRRSGVGTGTTSLLMIFTVLCFATLAMLSLGTAASNQRIQERGAMGAQALAQAKGEAAIYLANMDAALLSLQESYAKKAAFMQEDYIAEAAAAVLALGGWQKTDEPDVFTISVAAGKDTMLLSTVRIEPYTKGGKAARYILAGQISGPAQGWQPEAGGALWVPG